LQLLTTALACIAFLALAAVAMARARREPLAWRFAALGLGLFAYNAFDLVADGSAGIAAWTWLANASACLVTPLFYDFTMAFLGQRRLRRPSIVAAYAYFGALALASLAPVAAPSIAWFPGGSRWAALYLGGLVPAVLAGATRLARHGRGQPPEERARATLVLGAAVVAGSGAAFDLGAIAGGSALRLSVPAELAAAALLSAIAMRSRLLEQVSALVALNALAAAIVVVLGEVALLRFVGEQSALFAAGSVVIALSALFAGRFLLGAVAEARERTRTQAMLGRMAEQLAHDVRNPLATIRGAAEFLMGEIEEGQPPGPHAEMLETIVDATGRIERMVADYQRMARVEPRLRPVDLNDVVRAALGGAGGRVPCHLDVDLPRCEIDPDLLVRALENVLRNAREAAGEGGRVEVATRHAAGVVTVTVSDDGPGMDARARERAFDEFFTTKATGSGLGLPFVRRVMQAHRGRVALASTEGAGTVVTLELPAIG
jgi:signal transduction histidine kinase